MVDILGLNPISIQYSTAMEKIDSVQTNLKGTKWKLNGIVDIETSELKELEPAHCKECYTLTFETDYFAPFRSINIIRNVDLLHLLENIPEEFNDMALRCEKYFEDNVDYCDSQEFRDGMAFTISYIITSNELKLFPRYRGYYLSFKPFETAEQ
jgi:hypothetical protein